MARLRRGDPRWKRTFTDLVYLPQMELLRFLRAKGYKTLIVTGGGQDFVRVYSGRMYDIPPEQVVGRPAGSTTSMPRAAARADQGAEASPQR